MDRHIKRTGISLEISVLDFFIRSSMLRLFSLRLLLDSRKALLQIVYDILDIFKTYGKSYHSAVYACGNELFV